MSYAKKYAGNLIWNFNIALQCNKNTSRRVCLYCNYSSKMSSNVFDPSQSATGALTQF